MTDPLAPLLDLPDVGPAVTQAREAVDAALRHRALRRSGGQVAAEVSLRSAVASAALSGHRYAVDDVRAGTVLDPVMQGALRVAQELPTLAEKWSKAPRQVLARLHTIAASGVLPVERLGRPADDPLVAQRLSSLCDLVVASAGEPIIRAAVVHGELLALNAFEDGTGVVARAAARATLIGSAFDIRGLIAVDLGHLAREPEYVGSAHAFATGTPDGVRSWLKHYATAIVVGAEEFTKIADDVLASA
ncbi:MAG: oxidoreductase [Hamadaea sp.]|nr:oxidoreductase [Hamadaea sp.]